MMKSFKNFFVEHYRDEIGFNDRQVNLNDKELERNLKIEIDKVYNEYRNILLSASKNNDFDLIQNTVSKIYSFDKIYDEILQNVLDSYGNSTPIDKNNKVAKLYYQSTRNKFARLPQSLSTVL